MSLHKVNSTLIRKWDTSLALTHEMGLDVMLHLCVS